MADHIETNCPECSQKLRIPGRIGGMLMACPSCGTKFHSDFKLAGGRTTLGRLPQQGLLAGIFGLPYALVNRIRRYFSR